MNYKIYWSVILTLVLLVFSSCEMEEVEDFSSLDNPLLPRFEGEINPENNISISVVSIQGKEGAGGITINGQFTADGNSLEKVNEFSINKKPISFKTDRYVEFYSDSRRDDYLEILDQFSDREITLNVENNSDTNISDYSLHNPKPITFGINQDHRNISKKKGLKLTWEGGEPRNGEFVGISVIHRGKIDDDNVDLPNISFHTITEDDGEFFISGKYLAKFPKDCQIDVNLVRGTYDVIEHSKEVETLIISHSLDSHRGVIVD